MANIFFASDHHFHHKNILTFKDSDDNLIREFDDVDHMNEHMIYCHNRVVRPADKVYFVGDVCMSRNAKGLEILGRLNGEKILVKGNHDMWMFDYFKKELGVQIISDELILERNGKRFFLHHGDGLGPSDAKYKILKKIFRSNFCQWFFALESSFF